MRDAMRIHDEVLKAAAEVFAAHGIAREHVCLTALVSYSQVQSAVIRQEYEDRREAGCLDSLRARIAAEMGVSLPVVKKALYVK